MVGHIVLALSVCEYRPINTTNHHACPGSNPHFDRASHGGRPLQLPLFAAKKEKLTTGNRNMHPAGTSYQPYLIDSHGTSTSYRSGIVANLVHAKLGIVSILHSI